MAEPPLNERDSRLWFVFGEVVKCEIVKVLPVPMLPIPNLSVGLTAKTQSATAVALAYADWYWLLDLATITHWQHS